MIKGIFLKDPLFMETVSTEDIIGELDPLHNIGKPETITSDVYTMVKREFFDKFFFLTSYTFSDEKGVDIMWNLFDTIQQGIPNFFKVIKYANNVLVTAYPKPNDYKDINTVQNLMDEITRVTAFLQNEYHNDKELVISKIHKYFEMCVSYE